MASKKKEKRVRNEYEEEEGGRPKKIPRTLAEKDSQKRLILVLENASLETIKVYAHFTNKTRPRYESPRKWIKQALR